MRALVIGGGLLGGTVAEVLGRTEREVVVFSRSFGGHLEDASGHVRTVRGSVAHEARLRELIDAADVVFYLAGGSTPAGADSDAGDSVALSVVPATTVLELMRDTSTRRIVLASSGGTVYGEPQVIPTPEDHSTEPIGIHGHNALTVERYAGFFARRYALEPLILRVATAYGPGQRTRRGQGVISAWTDAAIAGEPLNVYGSAETRRDFVFAEDVATAAIQVALNAPPGVYNVGSGGSHSLEDVIRLMNEIAGHDLGVVRRPARGIDVSHTELDCARIEAAVGWRARTSLRDGLRATWSWALERATRSVPS